jgi:hypothetical protein
MQQYICRLCAIEAIITLPRVSKTIGVTEGAGKLRKSQKGAGKKESSLSDRKRRAEVICRPVDSSTNVLDYLPFAFRSSLCPVAKRLTQFSYSDKLEIIYIVISVSMNIYSGERSNKSS